MSASISSPDVSRMPVSVKVSMVSVTIDAVPRRRALKRSPSGTRHSRWSHGSYVGLKCSSTSISGGSCLDGVLADEAAQHVGALAAELVAAERDQDALPPHDRVGDPLGQPLQPLGDRVAARRREDVRRRALQHRHVLGVRRHRRHQCHRGRATADDDDLLACVVEVLGPVLGVHDLSREVVLAREGRARTRPRSRSSRCSRAGTRPRSRCGPSGVSTLRPSSGRSRCPSRRGPPCGRSG